MRKSQRRLIVIGCAAVVLTAAVALAFVGLRQSAAFFRTPSELLAEPGQDGRSVRVGGLVALGSLRSEDLAVVFTLGDDVASIDVVYTGILPSLFREGQCVIAEGTVGADGRFEARRVLAKHDESYQAPDIQAAPRLALSCGRPPAGGIS